MSSQRTEKVFTEWATSKEAYEYLAKRDEFEIVDDAQIDDEFIEKTFDDAKAFDEFIATRKWEGSSGE